MSKNITKNINIYPINHKFNNNLQLLLDIPETSVSLIPTNDSIHKYIYTSIDQRIEQIFIINTSIINTEIKQFIDTTYDKIRIHILRDSNYDQSFPKDIQVFEPPNSLINKQLYNGDNTKTNDNIVYFYKHGSSIHNKLNDLLYPKTKLPIIIFDGMNIKHPQSVGFTNEIEKQKILSSSKYYLHDKDGYYRNEAILCNCHCIDLDAELDIEQQINKQFDNKFISEPISYLDFLNEHIL